MIVSVVCLLLLFFAPPVWSNNQRCTPLPSGNNDDRWLHASTAIGGLCNQIGAVMSYIPAAKIFSMNVVVSAVYSRHSFEDHWPTPDSKWSPLPFSWFFDMEHFQRFWSQRRIDAVDIETFQNRCPVHDQPSAASGTIYNITRNPAFGAVPKATLLKMLRQSNLPTPLPSSAVYQISARIKYLTLYNFWEDPELLLDVYRSLQPAPILRKFVVSLQKQLDGPYIAVHLRLEPDYWGHNTSHTLIEVDKAMWWLSTAPCLQPHRSANGSGSGVFVTVQGERRELPLFDGAQLPRVYISSGLFGADVKEAPASLTASREWAHRATKGVTVAKQTQHYLKAMGLTLVNQMRLLRPLFRHIDATQDEAAREKWGDPFKYRLLAPEQLAFIDLEMARLATCFIPAHVGSSFSYLATRMRDWDRGVTLSFDEVHGPTTRDNIATHGICHDFSNWGF